MKHETILKRLKEIKDAKSGKKAKEKLENLIKAIETYIEDKNKDKIDIRHLMGWYLKLWNDEPPEKLMSTKYTAIIGKHLKELVKIYQQNKETIDQLKADYENFKNTQKKGAKGITQFRALLPAIKQAQKNTKIKKDRWISDEFRHDDSIYGKSVIDADDLIPEEINNEDVPF